MPRDLWPKPRIGLRNRRSSTKESPWGRKAETCLASAEGLTRICRHQERVHSVIFCAEWGNRGF